MWILGVVLILSLFMGTMIFGPVDVSKGNFYASGLSVGLLVGLSVGRLVCWSVGNKFQKSLKTLAEAYSCLQVCVKWTWAATLPNISEKLEYRSLFQECNTHDQWFQTKKDQECYPWDLKYYTQKIRNVIYWKISTQNNILHWSMSTAKILKKGYPEKKASNARLFLGSMFSVLNILFPVTTFQCIIFLGVAIFQCTIFLRVPTFWCATSTRIFSIFLILRGKLG